jgi:HTH-type transcriptional regulator, sugar sensing transcriptional regulator
VHVPHDRSAEQISELTAMGLPAYAVRAYLGLLQLGVGEARQVSELAKIRPAKVYGTLDQLERRGLVTIIPGKPRKYQPVPIAEFLARRIEEEREAIDTMSSRLDRMAELFPVVGRPADDERATITTLRGRRNISEHFRREAIGAQKEISVHLPSKWPKRVRALGKLVGEARQRGVQARLFRPPDDSGDPARELEDATEACDAHPLGSDVLLATFDGRSALLAHFVPDQSARDHPKDIAIVTHERALASAIAAMLAHPRAAAQPEAHPAAEERFPRATP